MNNTLKRAAQFILFLFIGIVLLWFAFRNISLSDMLEQLRKADFRWVAFSLVFAVLALFARTYRWRMLMDAVDARPSPANILHSINIGYLANFVFPRLGEITRCGILNRTDHVPVDKALGTVIIERVFDVLMVLLLLLLVLLFKFKQVGGYLDEKIFTPLIERLPGVSGVLWMTAIGLAAIALCYLCYRLLKHYLVQHPAWMKIRGWLHGMMEGIRSVKHVKHPLLFAFLNIAVFACYYLQTYIMCFAFEFSSALTPSDGLFIILISTLAMVVPVQGGIGVFHTTIAAGMMIFGLSYEDGLVYATMSHTTTSLLLILMGAVSLIYVFVKFKPKIETDKP